MDLCCNVAVVEAEAVGGGDLQLEAAEWELGLRPPMAAGSGERSGMCCSHRWPHGDANEVSFHPVLCHVLHCGKSPYLGLRPAETS